ncbi:MAG TPA: HigA family addiction module antitoxin [Candidatus Angelobacter sp.]|nr:HigA family addiction module antitoxin [Candidatus Angelobacter sp.]
MTTMFNPSHPGRVLRRYLGEMTVSNAARRLGVTSANLSNILNEKAGISAAMSLRLSAAMGTSPDFWFKMQNQYEMAQSLKRDNPRSSRFLPR